MLDSTVKVVERSEDQKSKLSCMGADKSLGGINMLTKQEAFLTNRVANPGAMPFIPLDDLREIIAEPPDFKHS